ncbi:hypothetical protein [Armatimonas rosea]|uniref:DUF4440 domain-containing protein n=1 Tax=Armatimonas rosea TaxID=685828 RepID=A0A7W9SVB1_ARMRO|nr:hypothetical protein [Armatimonas rosea]MBB6053510.1 hypothetical protein [Armatimonas rosea]
MSKVSKIVVALCLLLLVAAGIWSLAPRPAATPELQIAESLQEAADAAQAGHVSAMMDLISEDFKSGMLNKARMRLLLNNAKSSGRGVKYDVKITPPKVLESADKDPKQRVVFTSASVLGDGSETLWGGNQLTLVMRQESRRRNLFFTEPHWRVISIANMPPLPGEAE